MRILNLEDFMKEKLRNDTMNEYPIQRVYN